MTYGRSSAIFPQLTANSGKKWDNDVIGDAPSRSNPRARAAWVRPSTNIKTF
jgi:hypothetical protein